MLDVDEAPQNVLAKRTGAGHGGGRHGRDRRPRRREMDRDALKDVLGERIDMHAYA